MASFPALSSHDQVIVVSTACRSSFAANCAAFSNLCLVLTTSCHFSGQLYAPHRESYEQSLDGHSRTILLRSHNTMYSQPPLSKLKSHDQTYHCWHSKQKSPRCHLLGRP